jgi:hypothetical protein
MAQEKRKGKKQITAHKTHIKETTDHICLLPLPPKTMNDIK